MYQYAWFIFFVNKIRANNYSLVMNGTALLYFIISLLNAIDKNEDCFKS